MRYAVYFCPAAGSALDTFGREWLATETVPGIAPARMQALLADVRRYGWHATLSAPGALAAGIAYDELRQALVELAARFAAFELPLRLDNLAGFLALRPAVDEAAVRTLAAQCVRRLNPLRAPLERAELQRRSAGLDGVELALLRQYGYPFVLDRYRFHMTLAAPTDEVEQAALHAWLAPRLGTEVSARIDALSLCREAEPGAAFEIIERILLRAGAVA